MRPYSAGDDPAPGSVPVTVVILTKNEEANVGRCLSSVAWAGQVVVVDSGSTDATLAIAGGRDAEIIEQPWLGYAAQREFAMRHHAVRHDWVYFVDADEWVSAPLAGEVAQVLSVPAGAAYAQRFRVVFEGRWIRHCGWYGGSWIVRLMDRRRARFDSSLVGERASVDGPVGRLRHDLVDDDRKGLAAWLHKHIDYAAMEAHQRGRPLPTAERLRRLRSRPNSRPIIRAILKDLVFPVVPAKPVALFAYMYLARFGFLDGLPGLRFCFYHAWYESCVAALRTPRPEPDRAAPVPFAVLDFHQVGAAPDPVAGLGEINPAGDVAALAAALARALDRVAASSADADLAKRLRERVDHYGIEVTAARFEQAAMPRTGLRRHT